MILPVGGLVVYRPGILGLTVLAPPGMAIHAPSTNDERTTDGEINKREGAPARSPTQGQRAVPSGPKGLLI